MTKEQAAYLAGQRVYDKLIAALYKISPFQSYAEPLDFAIACARADKFRPAGASEYRQILGAFFAGLRDDAGSAAGLAYLSPAYQLAYLAGVRVARDYKEIVAAARADITPGARGLRGYCRHKKRGGVSTLDPRS